MTRLAIFVSLVLLAGCAEAREPVTPTETVPDAGRDLSFLHDPGFVYYDCPEEVRQLTENPIWDPITRERLRPDPDWGALGCPEGMTAACNPLLLERFPYDRDDWTGCLWSWEPVAGEWTHIPICNGIVSIWSVICVDDALR